jgi:hypothetical protein
VSAAKATKAALYTACQALFPEPILVTYGPAGTYLADDTIELLAIRSSEDVATMSNLRRREEALELDGLITVYRGGGTEVQQLVTERAYDLLETLADYLQDSGVTASTQITLGNVVREARVIGHEMTEADEDIDEGRTTSISFTVLAKTRV